MSTKLSISVSQHHHLYEEVLDKEFVYLELEHVHFLASSSADFVGPPTITVQLPRPLAVQLGLVPHSDESG